MKSDNYWFKAKRYGWGWYPSSWQGWTVLALYIGALVWKFRGIDAYSHSASDTLLGLVVPYVVLTVLLILICYATGEKPRWRWG